MYVQLILIQFDGHIRFCISNAIKRIEETLSNHKIMIIGVDLMIKLVFISYFKENVNFR